MTGPVELDSFRRAVVGELATDRIMDLTWVADSHGGQFPQLSHAYSLVGSEASLLQSVTVDPSLEPRRFDPYCSPALLDGILQCTRIRLREAGDWEIEVYFTLPPDSTPRQEPELSYGGRGAVASVTHRPQPLRVWAYHMTDGGELTRIRAVLDEGVTAVRPEGPGLELVLEGELEATLQSPEEIRADLTVAGLQSCSSLRITFRAVRDGAHDGEIRCGSRVLADLIFERGEPVDVSWRD